MQPRWACGVGLFCLAAMIRSRIRCGTAVTVAYIAAGAGRTYGRPKIAQLQVLLACGPMALALIIHGDFYYIGFAFLNVLFFVGLRRITLRLHDVPVKALLATERVGSIAGQFDTALNNMPNGLCMFGADGRLAVLNNRFTAMMEISEDLVQRGVTAREVVVALRQCGTVSSASAMTIITEIESSKAAEITTLDHAHESERIVVEVSADGRRRHGRSA